VYIHKQSEIEREREREREDVLMFACVMKRTCREIDVLTIEKAIEDNMSSWCPGFNFHID
jgi:hypothetical protein